MKPGPFVSNTRKSAFDKATYLTYTNKQSYSVVRMKVVTLWPFYKSWFYVIKESSLRNLDSSIFDHIHTFNFIHKAPEIKGIYLDKTMPTFEEKRNLPKGLDEEIWVEPLQKSVSLRAIFNDYKGKNQSNEDIIKEVSLLLNSTTAEVIRLHIEYRFERKNINESIL